MVDARDLGPGLRRVRAPSVSARRACVRANVSDTRARVTSHREAVATRCTRACTVMTRVGWTHDSSSHVEKFLRTARTGRELHASTTCTHARPRATTRLYHYAWCSTRISRPMSTQRAYFAPPFECARASHVVHETTRASTRASRFGRKCLTFAREWVSIAHDDGGGASCTARGEMRSRVQTTERR